MMSKHLLFKFMVIHSIELFSNTDELRNLSSFLSY
jgi:hypothetical protein